MGHYKKNRVSKHRHQNQHGWKVHYHCPGCGMSVSSLLLITAHRILSHVLRWQ